MQNYGNYWLVLREKNEVIDTNELLLLVIDFEASQFSMTEKKTINTGIVEGLAFDQNDKRKFAIKVHEYVDGQGYTYFVTLGHITEDMRIVIDHPKIKLKKEWDYEKLCGQKFFGICTESDVSPAYYSINTENETLIKEFEFELDLDLLPIRYDDSMVIFPLF